jgi:hypothetical protein
LNFAQNIVSTMIHNATSTVYGIYFISQESWFDC